MVAITWWPWRAKWSAVAKRGQLRRSGCSISVIAGRCNHSFLIVPLNDHLCPVEWKFQRIPHSTKGGSGGWLHSLIRELPDAAEVGQRMCARR
jgi:hypothetical protein